MKFIEVGERIINLDDISVVEYASAKRDRVRLYMSGGYVAELSRQDSVVLMDALLKAIHGGEGDHD